MTDRMPAALRQCLHRHLTAALLCLLSALAPAAYAIDCSELPGGILDGAAGDVAPSQIQIDRNCTIRNFTESSPLSTNFSFLTQPGQNRERWLIVFDNVVHTGQMACNSVAGHKIWFTNGSSTSIQDNCQNLLIPVEKIDKQNPAGTTTATVGVPFTYTLTMPVLFDPGRSTVINVAGSVNDLHGVTLTDDLDETGVDLRYLSHTAYWRSSGMPVEHSFSNNDGLLTFDDFPIIPAGEQIMIELTVVLEDTTANAIGTSFINTAKWDFGRLIEGVFYEPLPGEWGISEPLTIAAPELQMTKTGPATLNLGQPADYLLDLQNKGSSAAWDVTLSDQLPSTPQGGLCDLAPEILNAQTFAADGSTPIAGKGPLAAGTDFTVDWTGAPACELTLRFTGPAATIDPDERLRVRYRTALDPRTRQGAVLPNVAGAIEWFNGGDDKPERQAYVRALTDGTPAVADHQDRHELTADLSGYVFEKRVANLTSGASPARTAEPGDRLRYSLYLRTLDAPLIGGRILDDLGSRNGESVFEAGSLTLLSATLPPGVNSTATDPRGGTNGAGLIDLKEIDLPAEASVTIEFEVTLAAAIADETLISNQAELFGVGKISDSDDPTVNGQSDPEVSGDEDPTELIITSSPAFEVHKISTDLTGDADVLLAGERLRYTITVRNVGSDAAVDTMLRDSVPANTRYVAGSTLLNGTTVADLDDGGFPLTEGLLLSTRADPTPGSLAVAVGGDTTATITFEVDINPATADGTVIANQAFISAPADAIVDQPSDDPRTAVPDDPTRDVVGNYPLLFATKQAELLIDNESPGIVDPGDSLRYTIRVYNNGSVPATGAQLIDAVPADTSYVADSVTLNGLAVGTPDGGTSPLIDGFWIASSDQTLSLPDRPDRAVLTPREVAEVQFDVRVNDDAARGALISNQATIATEELADLLTDGDGDPSTGPEPTLVVVGDAQQLVITKQVQVVGGGAAEAGAELEYLVVVRNLAAVPAQTVYLTDDLNDPLAYQLEYIPDSATLNGGSTGVAFDAGVLTGDYSASYGPLEPGQAISLRFRALLAADLPIGTSVTNVARVTWNTDQSATAAVTLDVGGVVGSGQLSGNLWHDADFDDIADAGERPLSGWLVDLLRNDELVKTATADGDGRWQMAGIAPNYATEDRYEILFRAPDATPASALLGTATSEFTNAPQRIYDIEIRSGSNLLNLNLPIDPNGVVYDALSRRPVSGASLFLVDSGTNRELPPSCFDDPNQQGQQTLSAGYYKFDLNFRDGSCLAADSYEVRVDAATGYETRLAELVQPPLDSAAGALDVPLCTADAVPATSAHCEVQRSEFAPPVELSGSDPGTGYYLRFRLDDSAVPGSAQVFNNHIPLDPILSGLVNVTKTTPMVNVTRGQLVPYTLTVNSTWAIPLNGVRVVDRYPVGFKYVEGSARLDGQPAEPRIEDGHLYWDNLTLAAETNHEITLLLVPGAAVVEGKYTNFAFSELILTGERLSAEAQATVRIVADPTFDCTDVTGKVFQDNDRDGRQFGDEPGIAGARLVTPTGLAVTTDRHGRFHITCAVTPHPVRGSNFTLKLDERSLPGGFRASTRALQIQRATRGKALHFRFGASVHRVVGLDVADPVFVQGTTTLRPQWAPRVELLLEELTASPAVLRIAYLADREDPALVKRRLRTLIRELRTAWRARAPGARLDVEQDVIWRTGSPPDRDRRLAEFKEARR